MTETNKFYDIRKKLGLSRREVADLIAELNPKVYDQFDENRLAKIEGTVSVYNVHPGEIVTLAKVYNMPELRNYYCCNDCTIGKMDAPEVSSDASVHEILVNMAVTLKNLNHSKIRLMEILEDGKVSYEEEQDFKRICDELEHISATVEELQFWCEKKNISTKK